ncbi:MAG: hypothetical protein Q4C03_05475, partial [bacterium]|nr:hypothetical protein [bacterium]
MNHPLKNVCKDLKLLLLGFLFSALLVLQPLTPAFNQTLSQKLRLDLLTQTAYAVDQPAQNQNQNQPTQTQTQQTQTTQPQDQTQQTQQTQDTQDAQVSTDSGDKPQKDVCRTESGSIGWLICPVINFLAKITDGIYDSIEAFLVVEPLAFDAQSPYHQIWSIFRDVTNVIFVIFLLVVIYSQLTGLGISNYGVKKALPKVVVAAILINLSYLICALAVDVSNILGASLRDFFLSVEKTIQPSGLLAGAASGAEINYVSLVGYLTGATLLGGLAIATSGGLGAIFLSLIPTLLAAIVAIAIAYITIATRQAMIFLLIMISPLAFVAQILPNTEKHYQTWKKSLTQMLIFYPVFAVLFGACSLVGWVIIASANSYLFIVLGMAVKIVPLFSAWKLLKMSGTLPGQISASLHGLTRRPLAAISTPLAQEAALKRAQYLAVNARPHQNFRRVAQRLEDRKNRRFLDTMEYVKAAKERGAGYAAEITTPEGKITRRGEALYSATVGNALEASAKMSHRNNIYEQGIEQYARSRKNAKRLAREDMRILTAADDSFMETSYGDWIKANNAISRRERLGSAINAHEQSSLYNRPVDASALSRYDRLSSIAEGNVVASKYITATATTAGNAQERLVSNQFQQYFATLPPTQHVEDALQDITNQHESSKYIEPILAGLRVLNQRGDTDLVKKHLRDALSDGQIELGTHASQSLATFLMFETKDSDFTLRRFGKYINLETARVFNEGQGINPDTGLPKNRVNRAVSLDEYATGQYIDYYDADGNAVMGKSKLAMADLLKGTPVNNIERTAFKTFDEVLKDAYGDDIDGLAKARARAIDSLMPSLISAAQSFPSGSEQLVNLASFMTGLSQNSNGEWVKTYEK